MQCEHCDTWQSDKPVCGWCQKPISARADLDRLRGAYRHLRHALDQLPCSNPRGECEELDAAGEIGDPGDWCIRCAALGNANDLLIAAGASK